MLNKTFKFILVTAVMILTISGCKIYKEEQPTEQKTVSFSSIKMASGSTIQTITDGSKLGLFAGKPIDKNNITLSIGTEGKVTAEQEVRWPSDESQMAQFTAYGPYDESWKNFGANSFNIPADQSEESSFNAADLVYDQTVTSAEDGDVSFTLKHQLPLIRLSFENKTDKDISSVTLFGLKTKVSIDLSNGNVTTKDDTTSITAHLVPSTTIGGADSYCAFVAPQTAKIRLTVTLSDKTIRGFTFKNATTMVGGKEYTPEGKLTIEESETPDPDVTTLKTLSDKTTKTETSFNIKVKNVIVTSVAKKTGSSSTSYYYIHLEDASGAMLLYTSSTSGLSAGKVINGYISGKTKLYNNLPEITSINVSSATITSTATLPLTEVTIDELNSNINSWLSKRVIIKNVKVTKALNGSASSSKDRTGTIQDNAGTSTIEIFTNTGASISKDKTGSLICFPAVYNATKQLNVYNSSDFEEGTTPLEPAEDSEFTKQTAPGIYDLSNESSPTRTFSVAEICQTSWAKLESSSRYSYIDFASNMLSIFTFSKSLITQGESYTLTLSGLGSGYPTGTYSVKAVKKSGTTIWFRDSDAKKGFIVTTE